MANGSWLPRKALMLRAILVLNTLMLIASISLYGLIYFQGFTWLNLFISCVIVTLLSLSQCLSVSI